MSPNLSFKHRRIVSHTSFRWARYCSLEESSIPPPQHQNKCQVSCCVSFSTWVPSRGLECLPGLFQRFDPTVLWVGVWNVFRDFLKDLIRPFSESGSGMSCLPGLSQRFDPTLLWVGVWNVFRDFLKDLIRPFSESGSGMSSGTFSKIWSDRSLSRGLECLPGLSQRFDPTVLWVGVWNVFRDFFKDLIRPFSESGSGMSSGTFSKIWSDRSLSRGLECLPGLSQRFDPTLLWVGVWNVFRDFLKDLIRPFSESGSGMSCLPGLSQRFDPTVLWVGVWNVFRDFFKDLIRPFSESGSGMSSGTFSKIWSDRSLSRGLECLPGLSQRFDPTVLWVGVWNVFRDFFKDLIRPFSESGSGVSSETFSKIWSDRSLTALIASLHRSRAGVAQPMYILNLKNFSKRMQPNNKIEVPDFVAESICLHLWFLPVGVKAVSIRVAFRSAITATTWRDL